MFALSFFGMIHVPINVPALGIAVQEDDVNINRELFGHGLSNLLSGCVGSIQNYLVFANSRLFIQNGGNSRWAGVLLALGTTGIWIAGPAMIGYIPIMIVGTLIFMLGIEMVQEALWDTFGKLHTLEYLMVSSRIMIRRSTRHEGLANKDRSSPSRSSWASTISSSESCSASSSPV
jgi:SulP family sulfate permease